MVIIEVDVSVELHVEYCSKTFLSRWNIDAYSSISVGLQNFWTTYGQTVMARKASSQAITRAMPEIDEPSTLYWFPLAATSPMHCCRTRIGCRGLDKQWFISCATIHECQNVRFLFWQMLGANAVVKMLKMRFLFEPSSSKLLHGIGSSTDFGTLCSSDWETN